MTLQIYKTQYPKSKCFSGNLQKKFLVSKELKIMKELVRLLNNKLPPELVIQWFDYLNVVNHHLIIKLTLNYDFKGLV